MRRHGHCAVPGSRFPALAWIFSYVCTVLDAIRMPPSEPDCLAAPRVPLALDDGVNLVAIRPVQVIRVPQDLAARVPRQALHVEHRGADADVQVLRRERVGRNRGRLLLGGGAVEAQLIERREHGVGAQAARRELLPDLLGNVSGHEGDRLVIDIPHPAEGQHVRAEFGPLAMEEVGDRSELELQKPDRGVGCNTTGGRR